MFVVCDFFNKMMTGMTMFRWWWWWCVLAYILICNLLRCSILKNLRASDSILIVGDCAFWLKLARRPPLNSAVAGPSFGPSCCSVKKAIRIMHLNKKNNFLREKLERLNFKLLLGECFSDFLLCYSRSEKQR